MVANKRLVTEEDITNVTLEQMKNSGDDYVYRLEYINSEGKREKIYNAISYDPVTQIVNDKWKFVTLDENGNEVSERIRPLTMRQTYRQEMKYLAELCGFEIADLYTGYKLKHADELTPSDLVWVLRKNSD